MLEIAGAGAASRRLPVVGVMGSGVHSHESLARPLGQGLARIGVHLLTGGGGGVMASVSRGFAEVEDRAGLVIGVMPAATEGPTQAPEGYPNRWVEVAIRTHLNRDGDDSASRNHVNILTSNVVVALPGGRGTASEVALAIRYGRPLVVLGDLQRMRTLPACVDGPMRASVQTAETAREALGFVREFAECRAK